MRTLFSTAILAIAVAATPAHAVTNLIKNGSFELGAPGTNGFLSWKKTNTPDGNPAQDQQASVITYNSTAQYPTGAYGEAVTPDNAASASPDAVGTQAAYFVGDFSVDETLSQLTYLNPGNFRIGFSYYLTANGLANDGNSSFTATILDTPVVSTMIDGSSAGQTWFYASGVAQITQSGWYNTAFKFNSNEFPSKDIVIDRVFAFRTNDIPSVLIPPTTLTAVPEPATWAMLLFGFGAVGMAARRRRTPVVFA
ncbi:PEPxxWA-CTERM sorting domain-containing protein [Polymorphobacter sp.]|uniref:PEPxxWA-CTERM sorting domain-containing protein n=1 Tax=Polymorphobacter sp. TaxID=1909290 RepID=UPI003F6EF9F0